MLDQLKRIDSASDVTKMREVLSQAVEVKDADEEREGLQREVQRVSELEQAKARLATEVELNPEADPLSTKGPLNVRFTENESIDVPAEQRNSNIHESVGPLATEMTRAADHSQGIGRNSESDGPKEAMLPRKEPPRASDRASELNIEPGDLRKRVDKAPKSTNVIFDKDKGLVNQTFELASNLDYMTETELDA